MEEKTDPFSFEKDLDATHAEEAALRKKLEAIRIETYEKIKNDPEIKEFLKPYYHLFHDSFLQGYAAQKSLWLEAQDKFKAKQIQKELAWQDLSRNAFSCVQKKKLLDLRKEWGAGSLKLPGIHSPFDFMRKLPEVFSLEFIPPITREDLDLLLAYVAQHEGYDLEFQFKHESTNFRIPLFIEDKKSSLMSGTYSLFHELNTNAGDLNVLPDNRGAIYQKYFGAYHRRKEEQKQALRAAQGLPPEEPIENFKILPSDKIWFLESFIQKFESREVLECYRNYRSYHNIFGEEDEDDGIESFSTILVRLEKIEDIIPIEANEDWRTAVRKAWNNYRKKTISSALIQAFDDYQFHLDTGILYHSEELTSNQQTEIKRMEEHFLAGREIMDEPRAFIFWDMDS